MKKISLMLSFLLVFAVMIPAYAHANLVEPTGKVVKIKITTFFI